MRISFEFVMFRLIIFTSLASVFRTTVATTGMTSQAVDFEVFGKVQGVFFRKYTKEEASKLGLRGWCMNTSKGTVLGHMQGPADKVEAMMNWLKTKGSPSSRIDKAEFRNLKTVTDYEFNSFNIRHSGEL